MISTLLRVSPLRSRNRAIETSSYSHVRKSLPGSRQVGGASCNVRAVASGLNMRAACRAKTGSGNTVRRTSYETTAGLPAGKPGTPTRRLPPPQTVPHPHSPPQSASPGICRTCRLAPMSRTSALRLDVAELGSDRRRNVCAKGCRRALRSRPARRCAVWRGTHSARPDTGEKAQNKTPLRLQTRGAGDFGRLWGAREESEGSGRA